MTDVTDTHGLCIARAVISKVLSTMQFLQPYQAIPFPSVPFAPDLKRGKK
jgi:hypothetical protein